jgi:hypothetical protein
METTYRFDDWFLHNWSRAALPLAAVIGLLSPLFFKAYGLIALLVVLHLVIYMVHQYEEHAHGKFRDFANQLLAGGQPKIGDLPIFWVNIIGVWGIYLLVIYGAIVVNPALGLISAYTTIVNGLLHIIAYVVTRRYNPGLISSLLLFLPIGAYTVFVISQSPDTTSADHVLGIVIAIIIHLITFGYLGRIARR